MTMDSKPKNVKEKLIGATGSISGGASILGSWQVCHNVCLGMIFLLSLVGITITGMPLLFLTKIAVPLWAVAVLILLATIVLYQTRKCISKNLIILNSGLIIAGTPFQNLQRFNVFFWAIGGFVALVGIVLFIRDRISNRRCHIEK
ncbi:hypothetical protein HYW20_05200 [Candidatus Woesearchaeota archaeon]|nr:hypothetical protein [Candidatus Woesearchaeota archaeon]